MWHNQGKILLLPQHITWSAIKISWVLTTSNQGYCISSLPMQLKSKVPALEHVPSSPLAPSLTLNKG